MHWRIRSAVATFLLIMALGCGAAFAQEGGTILFAVWGNESSDNIHRQVIAAFEEKNPHIKVELHKINSNLQDLIVQIAADTAPDLATVDFYDLANFIENGMALDITEWAERDGYSQLEELHPAAKGEMFYKGRQYSVANLLINPDALFYNKDLFQEAGLPYPTDNWTISDMEEAAVRLTRKAADGTVTQWGMEFHRFFIWPFIRMAGGQLLNDDLTYAPFDEPVVYNALQRLADLDLTHDAIAWNPYERSGAFQEGLAGMHIMWTNLFYGLRGSVAWDWDIAPIPAGDLGSIGTVKGNPVIIPPNAPNPELAWEFMKFLGSEEAQYIYGSLGRFTPMHRAALAGVVRDSEGLPPQNLRSLLTWRMEPLPNVPGFRQVQDMWLGELEPVWMGETPARVAGERIRELSTSILEEYRR